MTKVSLMVIGTGHEPIPPRLYGGVEEHIFHLIYGLLNNSYRVLLIDINKKDRVDMPRLRKLKTFGDLFVRIEGRTSKCPVIRDIIFMIHAIRYCLTFKNICHVILNFYDVLPLPLNIIIKTLSKKTIIYHTAAHDPWLIPTRKLTFGKKLAIILRTLNIRFSDFVTTPSDIMARRLISFAKPQRGIIIAPNCPDKAFFALFERRREHWRGRSRKKVVLFVGHLTRRKGIDIVIKALAKIIKELNWDCILIAAGPVSSGNLRNLLRLCKKLHIVDRVIILGLVDRVTLLKLYAIADVFILPSSLEAGRPPIAILQALAAGIPVITTAEASSPESKNAVMMVHRDPDEVAKSLIKLFRDERLYNQLVMKGYHFVKRYHSNEALLKAYSNILDQLEPRH